jgi:pyridoxal phosphate enzyme (YggS family)
VISENLARVRERIERAAARVGRRAEDITLVGVSKTISAEKIQEAYEAGVRHFGENRVQEREEKSEVIGCPDAVWHLVGHLQSNKAKRAAKLFHSVDSIDTWPLAQRLDKAMKERVTREGAGRLRVLIEVRISEETTKTGAHEADLPKLAANVLALPNLDLQGLMCIPPLFGEVEPVRAYFRRLRELRDQLAARLGIPLPVLSMGMSHDFEVAIEEGATEVRVGTALFGEREAARGAGHA